MTRHVLGVFDDAEQVHRAVETLIGEGITEDRLSVLRWEDPKHGEELLEYTQEERAEAINAGLWSGGALGAIAGILTEAVALVMAPPIGVLAVAGALAAALGGATVGATVGGFVGALMKIGLNQPDAEHLMDRMKAGSVVLAATVPTAKARATSERLTALGAQEVKVA